MSCLLVINDLVTEGQHIQETKTQKTHVNEYKSSNEHTQINTETLKTGSELKDDYMKIK